MHQQKQQKQSIAPRIHPLLIQIFVTLAATNTLPTVTAQKPSPCPDIFSYETRNTEQDRWYGVISLQTPEDLNGIWIHLVLDRPAELLGNWFGDAVSSDNKDYTIKNPKYKLEAGPPISVRFFVKYNAAGIVPSVQTIRLNGKTVCEDNRAARPPPTRPQLHLSEVRPAAAGSQGSSPGRPGHNGGAATPNFMGTAINNVRPSSSLTPDEDDQVIIKRPSDDSLSLSSDNDDGNFFPGDTAVNRPIFTRTTTARPPTTTRPQFGRQPACGTVADRASPLISHGQNTSKGKWPWHVALYHSEGVQLTYICGGTLISAQHVLTAAHCVTRPQTNRPVNPTSILIYLGKYSLKQFGPEVQDREIGEIYVHPNYNYTVYYNDIAILRLNIAADITNYVRPCCLWDDESVSIDNIINKMGTVVGWGFDENRRLSNNLMQAQMPVVSTVTCIYSNRDFFSQFTSETTYCAGFRNGTTVCNGDSGGGMVFPKPMSTNGGQNKQIWQIRGLVSVGVALQGQGVCDSSHYIVFTDVAKHLQWIRQTINRS